MGTGEESFRLVIQSASYQVTHGQLLLEQSQDIYLPVKYEDSDSAGIMMIHLQTITGQAPISAFDNLEE